MKETLYTINPNVHCLKCGNIGAIQAYGNWYPSGIGEKVDEFSNYPCKKYYGKAS
jgi:hypothetical protein